MATAPWTTLKFPHSYRPASARWPHFLRSWLPVLVCASIFAIESTAAFGANRTSAPLYAACHAIFGAAIDPRWSDIHHMIRKVGHFTGYGLFSLVVFRGVFLSIRQMRNLQLTAPARQWISHSMAIAAVADGATRFERSLAGAAILGLGQNRQGRQRDNFSG